MFCTGRRLVVDVGTATISMILIVLIGSLDKQKKYPDVGINVKWSFLRNKAGNFFSHFFLLFK